MKLGKIILFAAIVTGALFLFRGASVTYLAEPGGDAKTVAITIEPGTSVTDITEQLEEQGLLDAAFWFKVYGKLTGAATGIKAGSFELPEGLSVSDLYRALSAAVGSDEVVTFIEGWTLGDIATYMEAEGYGTRDEILALAADPMWAERYAFLEELPSGVDIEGYLYPDTYHVREGASAEDVFNKVLSIFEERVVDGLSQEVAAQDRSLFEIVTIASLLEAEVRGEEDRRMVADLIERRLAIGMPLQFDSTVNYVTGKNDPGVTLVDRDTPSPYNTYVNTGLPLGPIGNPSLQSIRAALDPKPNDYYFFLTTPEGEVIYAQNHDQHVQNKVRYLR